LDEIGVELTKADSARFLSDTHDDMLIFGQIQRLQGLEYAILIHGIDLQGHAPYCMPFATSHFARFDRGVRDMEVTDCSVAFFVAHF
jgi:hypothetical protein